MAVIVAIVILEIVIEGPRMRGAMLLLASVLNAFVASVANVSGSNAQWQRYGCWCSRCSWTGVSSIEC